MMAEPSRDAPEKSSSLGRSMKLVAWSMLGIRSRRASPLSRFLVRDLVVHMARLVVATQDDVVWDLQA